MQKRKNINFNEFASLHPESGLEELIDFYSVFDGSGIEDFSLSLFESVEAFLLKNYVEFKDRFRLDSLSSYALTLLAKNSRKRYSIHRKIKHFKALNITRKLLDSELLKLEKSKELKRINNKKQKHKKELRSYVIQDKLIFKDHFTRFFFYFLKPNEKLILEGRLSEVLSEIKENFEHYQSFCFEGLCREFLEKKFTVSPVQSYWDRDLELDLYYRDERLCLLGEAKFKNKKICKNVFNQLQNKAKNLRLRPDYYILFSKNGFSKELAKSYERNLLLFDLSDFKILL